MTDTPAMPSPRDINDNSTPRTDELAYKLWGTWAVPGEIEAFDLCRQLERELSHADAAGYARGLEDGAKVCEQIGEDWKEYGDYSTLNAAEYLASWIRKLKPAQDKGAAHE